MLISHQNSKNVRLQVTQEKIDSPGRERWVSSLPVRWTDCNDSFLEKEVSGITIVPLIARSKIQWKIHVEGNELFWLVLPANIDFIFRCLRCSFQSSRDYMDGLTIPVLSRTGANITLFRCGICFGLIPGKTSPIKPDDVTRLAIATFFK